jgi:hypothetical protein
VATGTGFMRTFIGTVLLSLVKAQQPQCGQRCHIWNTARAPHAADRTAPPPENYECTVGCICAGDWRTGEGHCVDSGPENDVFVIECPSKQDACGTAHKKPDFFNCHQDGWFAKVGVCTDYKPGFNGTTRSVRLSCVGTHLGKGNVTITDCASGEQWTVPNNDCGLQDGQWNNYHCYHQ